MAYVLIIASIFGQIIAVIQAIRLAFRQRRSGWIMVAIAVALMLGRRAFTYYNQISSGRVLDQVAEFLALLISVSLAVGLTWLLSWKTLPAPAVVEGGKTVLAPMQRMKKQALFLGGLAFICMAVLVYFSCRENNDSLTWALGIASILAVVLPLSFALLFQVSSVAQKAAVEAIVSQQKSEQALQGGAQAYRTLIETTNDLIWSMDKQGRLTFVNKAAERMLGYRPKEMMGRSFTDFQTQEEAAKDRVTLGRIMAGEVFFNYETRASHRDGTSVWLHINVIPLRDSQNVVIGATGTAQDITEWKLAELALRQSETRMRRLIESNIQGLIFTDTEGKISQANDLFLDIVGYTRGDLEGGRINWMNMTPPEYRTLDIMALEQLEIRGICDPWEKEYFRKDGTRVPVMVGVAKFADSRNEGVAFVIDITKRKQAERALRESEERFRLLINNAPEAVVIFDTSTGKFSQVNQAAERMFKLTAQELCLRGPVQMSPPEQPDGRPSAEKGPELVARALANETLVFEWTHRDAQDHDFLCEVRLLRFDLGGRAVLRASLTDITVRKQAEQGIHEILAKQKAILRAAPVGIGVSVNRVFIEVNDALCQMLGYQRDELVGRDARFLYESDEEYRRIGQANRQLGEIPKGVVETRYRRKDGGFSDVLVTVVLIDAANPSAGVIFTVLDITERKRVEQVSRLESAALEAAANAIAITNREGIIQWANAAFTKFSGYTVQEVVGQKVQLVKSGVHSQEFYQDLWQTILAGRVWHGQITNRHKDGRIYISEQTIAPVKDSRGEITHFVSVQQDITARKQAEDKAHHLANFPEQNPNPVLEFSAGGDLVYHNPAALGMARKVGFPHLQELLPPQVKLIVAECLSTGQPLLRMETRHEQHTLSWSFYPITAQQVVHCYVGDISKRLLLEEQFRQAQKMEAIGQLSGGVAHDFNNLLTVIMGNLGLVQSSGHVGKELLEPLQAIAHAASRAANLTRQLLAFSRQQVMQQQNLDLNAVVAHISKMLRRVIGESVNIRLDYALQTLSIHADPGMLEQVILNLCINARDAMPQGGQLSLRTSAMDITAEEARLMVAARAGSFALLAITDTGTGISPDNMKRVFEPFFTTKEVGKGTGLGLASVYGIAQQHNGWVTVESELGRGTTFTVFLPLLTTPPAANVEPTRNGKIPRGTETILLVEDDLAVQEVAKITLERLGYRVLVASNGHQALSIWQERKMEIELVLTDMIMPEGLSGRDIALLFKKDLPSMPIIFMSGYNADIAGTDFPRTDGDLFLGKPFEMHVLAGIIRKSLDALRGS